MGRAKEEDFYNAGKFMGEEVMLEKGMKMDLGTKIPLFFKIILTRIGLIMRGDYL